MIKRYTYKGTPLQEKMVEEICPDLNIDYKKLAEDKNMDKESV
jgi:hypothetical protein